MRMRSSRVETGTAFQLYRLPLQGTAATHVGGAFTDADMRAVKNIRITVVGARAQSLTLARMRIVGSRWIRRNQEGVLRGIAGDEIAGIGRVEVVPASRVTEGDAYQSPPGVLERLADPSAAFETVSLVPCAHERLLEQVFGVVERARHPIAVKPQLPGISACDTLERLDVAVLERGDDRGIVFV